MRFYNRIKRLFLLIIFSPLLHGAPTEGSSWQPHCSAVLSDPVVRISALQSPFSSQEIISYVSGKEPNLFAVDQNCNYVRMSIFYSPGDQISDVSLVSGSAGVLSFFLKAEADHGITELLINYPGGSVTGRHVKIYGSRVTAIKKSSKPRFYSISEQGNTLSALDLFGILDNLKLHTQPVNAPTDLAAASWQPTVHENSLSGELVAVVSEKQNRVSLFFLQGDEFTLLRELDIPEPSAVEIAVTGDNKVYLFVLSESSNQMSVLTLSDSGSLVPIRSLLLPSPSSVSVQALSNPEQIQIYAASYQTNRLYFYQMDVNNEQEEVKLIANTHVNKPADISTLRFASDTTTAAYVACEEGWQLFFPPNPSEAWFDGKSFFSGVAITSSVFMVEVFTKVLIDRIRARRTNSRINFTKL